MKELFLIIAWICIGVYILTLDFRLIGLGLLSEAAFFYLMWEEGNDRTRTRGGAN